MNYLSNKLYNNSTIIPFKVLDNKNYYGCVYDDKNCIINETIRVKTNCLYKNISPKTNEIIPKIYVNDNSLFIGHITNNYGHFLLETLSRFWIFISEKIKNLNIKNLIFIKWIDNNTHYILFNKLKNINFFNLKNYEIIVVNRPTKFNKLYIPQNLCFINNKILPQQQLIYRYISNKIPECNLHKFVYITRHNGSKRIKNEKSVINLFQSNNFYIHNATANNFINDIKIYKNCKVLAGIEGSNLHNVVFMPKNSILINICSHRTVTQNQINCNYINDIKCFYIPLSENSKGNILDLKFLNCNLKYLLNLI